MTTSTQDSTPKPVFRSFDTDCRAQVLAFIALGCSRRLAAEMAGCCHTTIGRAAERDPDFAAKLADAESHVDVKALTRINEATAENKNWRAAAWILERRHPDEFGRRSPHTFDGKQIMALLARIFTFTMPRLPEKQRREFLGDFELAMRDVEAQLRQPGQWRKMAEPRQRRNSGDDGPEVEYRSPYEHPQWEAPDAFERLMQQSPHDEEEFDEWVESLNYRDLKTFRDGVGRLNAALREETPQLFRDAQDIKRQMNEGEYGVEQGTGHPEYPLAGRESATAGPPEHAPIADQDAPPPPEPVAEAPASSDSPPAMKKRQQAAALQNVVPPAAQQPLQEHAESDAPPSTNLALRTPAEHQAYQERAARQHAVLCHNMLLTKSLERQPAAAPAAADQAGSAYYEERLKAWTKAMSR